MNAELWEQCNKTLNDKITEVSKQYLIIKNKYSLNNSTELEIKGDIFLENNVFITLLNLLDRQNLIIVELQRYVKYLKDELSHKKLIIENKGNRESPTNEKMFNMFFDKMFRQDILISELQNEIKRIQASNSPNNQTLRDTRNDISNAYHNNSMNYNLIPNSINTTLNKSPIDRQTSGSIKDRSNQLQTPQFFNHDNEFPLENERKNLKQKGAIENDKGEGMVINKISERKTKNLQQYVNKRNVVNQSKLSINTHQGSYPADNKIRRKMRSSLSQENMCIRTNSSLLNNSNLTPPTSRTHSISQTLSNKPTTSNMTQRLLSKYYQILEKYNKKTDDIDIHRPSENRSVTGRFAFEENKIKEKAYLNLLHSQMQAEK